MIISLLINKYEKYRNTVKYWRKRGADIGENVKIYSSVDLGSEPYLVKIGNNTRINNNVKITTHDGGVWILRNMKEEYKNIDIFAPVLIGNNVHIADNVVIMPGVTIGDNCIIGCSSVVTKDIPENSIAVGCPAKFIETVDEYIEKNSNKFDYIRSYNKAEKRRYLVEKFMC